jgi:hypothetical protein
MLRSIRLVEIDRSFTESYCLRNVGDYDGDSLGEDGVCSSEDNGRRTAPTS